MVKLRPNKSLHGPPGHSCHTLCSVMISASHEVRQLLAPVSQTVSYHSIMSTRNALLTIAAILSSWSCASTTSAPPFDEESTSGITFWVISPFQNRYVYSFNWNDTLLSVARSGEDGLVYYEIMVSTCPLLGARLVQFRESILESVEIVFNRKPANPPSPGNQFHEIVVDSPLYRARFVPDQFTTYVELEGIESSKVPWILAAQEVRNRAAACSES